MTAADSPSAISVFRLNPANRKITSVPRHREVKENTARAIFKQLDIPPP
jgi:DNA-directed RNA polymerase subunit H (RpoH/RPB5)